MAGIRLHPKHGVNPTISQCIVCGEHKNEIYLLGAAYKGEAPMSMVMDIEPCDTCKEKYLKNGVLMIEARQDKRPTGRLAVITDEAFNRTFNVEIPPRKICYVEPGVLQQLGI